MFPDGAICVLGAFILMASKYMRNQMYKVIGDYERGVTHAAAEKFSAVEERLEEGDEVEESLKEKEGAETGAGDDKSGGGEKA